MKLGAFLYPTGHHIAGWRHPEADAAAAFSFPHYAELARIAERGRFDMLFLADGLGVGGTDFKALSRGTVRYVAQFEPITLLSALSAVTSHIGLVATASTTYNEPYHVARKFASLDHLSGGRAGWNLVTTNNALEGQNFGFPEHADHSARYQRAQEFAEVVKGLWDSYEDDGFVRDKQSGIYFDHTKLHALHHKGEHFAVRGPLNVARSPQGQPVMVQAGSSETGKNLAASMAEVVYTAQPDLGDARAFYADLKGRTAALGRDPNHINIMPGVLVVVAQTDQEAQDRFQHLQSLIHPEISLFALSSMLGGMDLSKFPLDGPLPDIPESNESKSRIAELRKVAERGSMSIRQLAQYAAGARGHWIVVGSAKTVADALEERFVADAADGFNIMVPYFPGGLEDFVNLVIPELQRRRLFRTEYEGTTLRENLGLPRPPNRFTASA